MSEHKFTRGPWYWSDSYPTQDKADTWSLLSGDGLWILSCDGMSNSPQNFNPADARLIAAAPTQHEEMLRYLPIIERAEADPELWARLTDGTGIATANGYRAAIAKAGGETP